jgi:hypothetical protein
MKISLMQAVKLLADLHKKAAELEQELFTVHTIEIPKGESVEPYERTVEKVLAELQELQGDIVELDLILKKANLSAKVEWDGKDIPVITAIETAKILRKRALVFKRLGNTPPKKYNQQYGSSVLMEEIALFKPSEYKLKGEKILRQADLLSTRIDKVNLTLELVVPLADKHLEV